MGTNTKIQWADHTWNPWMGCEKVSQGCRNCYMYADMERFGRDARSVVRTSDATFYAPLKSKKFQSGDSVFTCSWSDFFIQQADEWRNDAWNVIQSRSDLRWLILTKRPELIRECLPKDWGVGWPNVWLGISFEDQKSFDERVPRFQSVPTLHRFFSFEPALELVDLTRIDDCKPEVIIMGGESGTGARPLDVDWARHTKLQCGLAGVPFFLKQLGSDVFSNEWKITLRDRKGGDPSEWPEDLQGDQDASRLPWRVG